MTPDDTSREPETNEAQRAAASKKVDQVNGWLHLGGAPAVEDYEHLRDAGITHVVDVRVDKELNADPARLAQMGIAYRRAPVPNFGAPTADQLDDVMKWFEASAPDSKVYVHCVGGIGRAATTAVGLLVLSGRGLDEAVQLVSQARPQIKIGPDQMVFLRTLEERRAATRSD
ncbi:MAG TPA: dual specificity protein phosphatase [Phenylobacterium sp.]|uniref:protein-tyrosine phosphatase family protein n=1 Tax=Phenylobacterium sp. TaxID=1871053 RepID=UPI002BD95093|nr:dual specificity protein phosphatase [Phenylobacterium sp.]HXA37495.1 dual specificity protein phosphatase [Phenylobacterium sp.]